VTAQNPQCRVQMSPKIMKVAVPSPQHSNMLGQRASWQTVCKLRSLIICDTRSNVSPERILTFNHSGLGPVSFGLAIYLASFHVGQLIF
jgi:hypothetical protein